VGLLYRTIGSSCDVPLNVMSCLGGGGGGGGWNGYGMADRLVHVQSWWGVWWCTRCVCVWYVWLMSSDEYSVYRLVHIE